jgi:hypothetical protein
MEGKRGIKRERSPSVEGSPATSDAKTPPLAPYGTPSPPGDFEFAQCLFRELNRDLLGPLSDDKVIILSDSDEEEEEAHKEKSVDVEDAATSSIVNLVSITSADDIGTPTEKSSTLAASPADTDNDPGVEPNDSSDDLVPGSMVEEGISGGDEAGAP